MAEANSTPLNEAELEQVRSILQPLTKNPDISEELNPMLSVFREKMGYGAPVSSDEDEDQEETGPKTDSDRPTSSDDDFDFDKDDFEEPARPQRPATKNFDDDDIDLDELLAEPTQSASSKTDDSDSFSDFGMDSEPTSTPGESDPFADLGTGPSSENAPDPDADPFGGLDDFGSTPASAEADPFADLGTGA
ncbi:hypothetical protein EHQ13_19545, partial [Leptospira gomenensis]